MKHDTKLWVVSAYTGEKKKGNLTQAPDDMSENISPCFTSETDLLLNSLDNSIDDDIQKING